MLLTKARCTPKKYQVLEQNCPAPLLSSGAVTCNQTPALPLLAFTALALAIMPFCSVLPPPRSSPNVTLAPCTHLQPQLAANSVDDPFLALIPSSGQYRAFLFSLSQRASSRSLSFSLCSHHGRKRYLMLL